MQFAVRAFQLAKDPEHPGQNEDAWKAERPWSTVLRIRPTARRLPHG